MVETQAPQSETSEQIEGQTQRGPSFRKLMGNLARLVINPLSPRRSAVSDAVNLREQNETYV